MCIDFRGRGKERDTERNTSRLVASRARPDRGSNPQPFTVQDDTPNPPARAALPICKWKNEKFLYLISTAVKTEMYFEHLKTGKGKLACVHQGKGLPRNLFDSALDISQCMETGLWNKGPDCTFSTHS